MSTHSAIIMKSGKGYKGIYCHSDGYLSWVGVVLYAHYQYPAKVAKLIALGDLSMLYPKLAPSKPGHSFSTPEEGVTIAYMRDRTQKGLEALTGKTIKDVAGKIGHSGYVYVFDGKSWWLYLPTYDREHDKWIWNENGMPLLDAIMRDAEASKRLREMYAADKTARKD